MSNHDDLITTDVDPYEIAQMAEEDLRLAIDVEKKSIPNALSSAETRTWIDCKMRNLQQSMRALAALRNILAPIDDLPDELLVEIFWKLRQSLRPDNASPGMIRWEQGCSWLAVLRVCRRWRRITVGTPKLYSFVDYRSPLLAQMCLRQSGDVPIHVYMQSKMPPNDGNTDMPLLQSHLHRVTRVEIHARHSTMSDLLRKNARHPAPKLQSLRLEVASVYRNLVSNDTVQLTTLFKEDTPSLRRLHLSSVAVPWTSSVLRGLTHLHMQFRDHHAGNPPSIEHFLQALESCPLLEVIKLERAGPILQPNIRQCPLPLRIVELPHLRELRLSSNRPIDTQYALAHLRTPSNALIVIHCKLESSDQDISHVLPSHCSGLDCLSKIRLLRLFVEDVQSIDVVGYSYLGKLLLDMSLSLGVDDGILKPRFFLSKFERYFPTGDLEELQLVGCASHISKETYSQVLGGMHNLVHLTASELEPARQMSLLSALTAPHHEKLVLPRLSCLRLSGMDDSPNATEDVARMCCARALQGAALDTLHWVGLNPAQVFDLLHVGVASSIKVDDRWVAEVSASPSSNFTPSRTNNRRYYVDVRMIVRSLSECKRFDG